MQPHQAHRAFWSSPEEPLRRTRWDYGDTTFTNEARLDKFLNAARARGGGYVGVGSLQNFVLAAWSDPEWIWLVDFTNVVVGANLAHIAFLKESETKEAYKALWQRSRRAIGYAVLDRHYRSHPELLFIQKAYKKATRFVLRGFSQITEWARRHRYQTWLTDQTLYRRMRQLALKGRIRALRGDLNGPVTLCGIGIAAKVMGVPIRVLYTSNAEEYKVFRPYPSQFRQNILNLPTDSQSVVLRTYSLAPDRFLWPTGWEKTSKVGFHYVGQPLLGFQRWLRKPRIDIRRIMSTVRDSDRDGFTMVDK